MDTTVTYMCQYGLRIPGRGPFVRKRTRLAGTPALVKQLGRLCPGTHTHTPVLCGTHKGRWMNAATQLNLLEKSSPVRKECLKKKEDAPKCSWKAEASRKKI